MSIEITEKIRELSSVAEESCIEAFRRIDRICRINQEKVLRAFVGCPVMHCDQARHVCNAQLTLSR